MTTEIVVCTTCERMADLIAEPDPSQWLPLPPVALPADRPPSRGAALARAIGALLAGEGPGAGTDEPPVRLRRVDCLGRCLSPGNVDLGARGKVRVEITALWAEDAPAVVAAARLHAAEPDVRPDQLPPTLAPRALIRLPLRRRGRMRD